MKTVGFIVFLCLLIVYRFKHRPEKEISINVHPKFSLIPKLFMFDFLFLVASFKQNSNNKYIFFNKMFLQIYKFIHFGAKTRYKI